MQSPNSKKLFTRAQEVMVGGVNSPVRSFKDVGGAPLVMQSGKGATLYDADGNGYTDYCLSWGASILGHAHRNVVLAAKKTAEKGLSFGTTTQPEIEMAEYIVRYIPSMERVRFVNSGTEATMSAIRLARGVTGRDMVVKFDGCYHGHVDDLLTKAGSGVAQLAQSSSLGIPQSHIDNTLSLPYNNTNLLRETLTKYNNKIACVIVEPVAGNMGVVVPQIEFLKILRLLTEQFKIILIFDEIITGFRFHKGGVQSEFGITPDLTCLGKIISGGFPVGCYGGKKSLMKALAPLGGVYQAGTFSGNPVVMKTGLAALKYMNDERYKWLNLRCEQFAQEINHFFQEENIAMHLSYYKSMMSLRFRHEPVMNYADAQAAAGGKRYAALFHFLLNKGIYWPPADLEASFVSMMHTKKDLGHLAAAIKEYCKKERG
jgi:glutamate-1-semialdehyde 2,1-aminomutase